MLQTNELGKAGEDMAAEYLKKKGYRILERNWRFGRNEIDIVARDGNIVVIAEVKTRSSSFFAEPETAVTRDKQRILVRSANAYVRYNRINLEVRFDVIAILFSPGGEQINHIEDAFYATL